MRAGDSTAVSCGFIDKIPSRCCPCLFLTTLDVALTTRTNTCRARQSVSSAIGYSCSMPRNTVSSYCRLTWCRKQSVFSDSRIGTNARLILVSSATATSRLNVSVGPLVRLTFISRLKTRLLLSFHLVLFSSRSYDIASIGILTLVS